MIERGEAWSKERVEDSASQALDRVVLVRHEIDAMIDRAQVRIGNDSALQHKLGDLQRAYTTRFEMLARNIRRLATSTMLMGVVACSPRENVGPHEPDPPSIEVQTPPALPIIPAEQVAVRSDAEKKQEFDDLMSAMRGLIKKHRIVHDSDIAKYLKFGTREHSFVEIATRDGGIKFLFDDQKGDMRSVDTMSPKKLAKFIPKNSTIRVTLLHTHPLNNSFFAGHTKALIEQVRLHPETSLPVPPSDIDFSAHLINLAEFSEFLPRVRLEQGVYDRSGVVWRVFINPDSPLLKPGVIKEYKRVSKLREKVMTKQEKQMLDTIRKLDEGNGGETDIQRIRDSEQYQKWHKRMQDLETPDYLLARHFVSSANRHRFDMWYEWEKDGYKQGERTKKSIQDFITAMKDEYKVDITCTPRRN